MVSERFSCHNIPKGKIGYDHQNQGFNIKMFGNVIAPFKPHGVCHFIFKSKNQGINTF